MREHIDNLVAVFREVRRVLRDDGTLWLNYGDAYAGSGKGLNGDGESGKVGDKQATNVGSMGGIVPGKRMPRGSGRWGHGDNKVDGLPAKNLMGLPWRVAFALQDDGWFLRSAIVWAKPNPMPESAKDRPTSSYEMIFLLTKKAKYYYDAEAIKIPWAKSSIARLSQPTFDQQNGGPKDSLTGNRSHREGPRESETAASKRLG